ncbi:MAG TPA: amidohydrolase [Candidatus Ozemobacteraceae bacterium]|nr:amidohydrolase [Candidatus Ozemobacteraceae bacterium]
MNNIYADIILIHARLWPGRTAVRPRPDKAIAITDDRISWIGDSDSYAVRRGPGTEVIDLCGALVIPGFRDAHLHPMIGAIDLIECRLSGPAEPALYLAQLREYAARHPNRPFIRGSGWIYAAFPKNGPHRRDIDQVVPDRPVFLKAIDGHSGWVNSAALRLAGITRETPDPAGGAIEREAGSGEPTGFLREWPAMGMVTGKLPKPGLDEYIEGARLFLAQAAKFGITAIHDAMGKPPFIMAWERLEQLEELTLHVTASQFGNPERGAEHVEELLEIRNRWKSPRRRIGPAKIALDGVVEGRTALLLEPYADAQNTIGEAMWDPDDVRRLVAALDAVGFQTHFHAVGDAAVRLALDALEAAQKANGRRDSRHMIAHADLIDKTDVPRFAKLGVIANLQPAWYYRDSNFDGVALPCLGKERAFRQFALRSLRDAAAPLAFSSDWPFGGDMLTFNPLDGIETAMTRCGTGKNGVEPFVPEQAVDLVTMLDGFTRGPAFADFDDDAGVLEVGKRADLAVLDRDLFVIPASEIHEARVRLTVAAGCITWRDLSL